ncbi:MULTISPECIES: L-piperidine-6-carboxylate dehydrogenase [Methylosinus]|uniref:aldehyde dehydrogenase (NAD(+)) n=1 Tax=Methylosinus trichosporium (strain ATCC 35070 / NCIMB 11131 / UNIQEM 75 / OB3b) TaxID=595536 RepID=A0A2D2D3J6_METT3|nr:MULTISPECIES: aldehyde dehydrogenase family protein [Methylosinus]ATQ69544.1 aldehyde dehydrogenase family protein [Methylosinus trichosporium OB3b]OBS50496.1 aldehyde dehydrogenase [Methylosinus sp. 3S-1]
MQTPTKPCGIATNAADILGKLNVESELFERGSLHSRSPITGEVIASVKTSDNVALDRAIAAADAAFRRWRMVPPPRRGELVRLLGEELRAAKSELAQLVTIEAGKIASEAQGEVQEMIDICDYAVGLSRQLYGLTIATERPGHRMMETWHPLGVVGIVTSFNFPVAVWAWNAAIALVCGDALVWKPSEKTPLTALATQALFERAAKRFGDEAPKGLCSLAIGGRELGEALVDDKRVPLVSATGSTAMGRAVGPRLAQRFARSILELGGNNAAIVCPSASLDLAVRAIAFSAMGTAGQRCTSLRRLIAHDSVYDQLLPRLHSAYRTVAVGDPREGKHLVGPLIDEDSYRRMRDALAEARDLGARVTGGERILSDRWPNAFYARPALVELREQAAVARRETFAPILYAMRYRDLAEAVAMQNDVSHGLASSIFTSDLREAERFLSPEGSDCGIANVNIGPSGAEIGGAFGGEKETGGGREAGSDAWKAYMRRATNTINYSSALPLAQGVQFDL